jgi:hypothetical protein
MFSSFHVGVTGVGNSGRTAEFPYSHEQPHAKPSVQNVTLAGLSTEAGSKQRRVFDRASYALLLSHLPKLGVPMIMRQIARGEHKGEAKVWSYPGMEKVVQQMRKKIDGVSKLFTLDACRHGGMTELEEAKQRHSPIPRLVKSEIAAPD